jgi:hypothetical protein
VARVANLASVTSLKQKKGAAFVITDPLAPRKASDKDIANVASELWQDVISRTPVDTGNLIGGWKIRKIRDGLYHVYNDVDYAKFVEFGTNDTDAVPAMGKSLVGVRAKYQRRRKK